MSPFIKRVISGMGANAYGQIVNIVIQLVSLPIFLSQWDLRTYGIWLTLSAIPAYFSMADVGMVSVAGTRMTILSGANDYKAANRVFQSAQLFVGLSCLSVAGIALPIIALAPFDVLQAPGTRSTLFALVLVVLMSMASGLSSAVYKATHRYALGTFIETNVRLLEWFGSLIGLIWIGSFFAVAMGMLLVRTATLLIVALISTKGDTNLKWGTTHASRLELKNMIAPSIGYMSFPIANALSFQGFTLLAAATLGPLAVAMFNIYRTVARVVVQITSVLSHALGPELSRMHGTGSNERFRKIAIRTSILGATSSIFMSIGVWIISPYLLDFWTKGKIDFMPTLMALFLLYAAIAGSWHIPRIVLMALNNHSRLGFIVVIFSTASLALAWVLGVLHGIEGLVIAMVVSELCIATICIYLAKSTFQVDPAKMHP